MNRVALNLDKSGSSGSSRCVEGLHTHSQIPVFNSELSVQSETSLPKLANRMRRLHGCAASDLLMSHFKRSNCNFTARISARASLLLPLLEDRCSSFAPAYRRLTEVDAR